MTDRARDILMTALRAGRFGAPPEPEMASAIREGQKLKLDELDFDSLAWMEFCISVELQSGLDLAPSDIEEMQFTSQIEDWLRARLATV
jgi:acyl carrier protein